ncbi:MAG: phosphodiester glycosidase family protein [Anaerolineales bacterium]|nr:phosphodiester glycosidase family protein [Anaerolineales bacterium]
MKNQKKIPFLILMVALILSTLACEVSGKAPASGAAGAGSDWTTLYKGIEYKKEVRTSPRPMVIHVVKIDLKEEGIKSLVTPGYADANRPLKAKTTSDFLKGEGVQLAVNGDAFHPWYMLGPIYYPHMGDSVSPYGFAASRGEIYSQDTDEEPTLYLYENNKASINDLIGKTYNAISGTDLLIKNGVVVSDLKNSTAQPRTAVALDRPGRRIIIVIVDGRQPGYSEGATLAEMASLLLENQGYTGMNLDGGGSTTLVISDADGNPQVLNSPVHTGVPGTERPVANHLGFFAKKK